MIYHIYEISKPHPDNGYWVKELRYYENKKELTDPDLCDVAGKRREVRYVGLGPMMTTKKHVVLPVEQVVEIEEDTEWPQSELIEGFDWSLSMEQIIRKYSPVKKPNQRVIDKFIKELGWPTKEELNEIRPEPPRVGPVRYKEYYKLLKKYPHANELLLSINSDFPRWLFENIVKPLSV